MNTINIQKMIRTIFIVLISFIISQGNLSAQNSSSKNSDNNKENTYNKIARDLSAKLSHRVNLTKDQSDKVRDILVDYQKDVADKWDKGTSDNSANKGLTDDFRDADKKANDKIEKTLNGNELSEYLNTKKEWWSKIKDRVYSKDFYTLITFKEEDEDNNANENTGSNTKITSDNDKTSNKNKSSNNQASNNNAVSSDKDMNAKFEPFAKQWATELMNKLNLSLQQAADIQDALIDYQKTVADLRLRASNENNNGNAQVANNSKNNGNENMVGSSSNNRTSEFTDIDNSTNDKIEKVLNDNQKPKYEKAKKTWWKDVKDRVFSNIRKENQSNNMTSTSSK